uniref:Uncharacterized protein n=1 Tax=viral metagenome TaxID=1070528 RepID=A0A6C0BJ00_9ZZZZ
MSGPIGLGLGNGGPSLAELLQVPARPQNSKYTEIMSRIPKKYLWTFVGSYNYYKTYETEEATEAFLQRILDRINRVPASSSSRKRTRKRKQIK